MIAKKNSRYDLERKRIVFFQIGLFATGSLTLAAFTYKTPVQTESRKMEVAYQHVVMTEEEMKEIPKKDDLVMKDIPQPPTTGNPTVVADPNISAAITPSSNTLTNPTAGVIAGTGNLIIGDITDLGGPVVVDIEIIDIPVIDAAYVGGYVAMQKFIQENLIFPQDAIEMNIQGRVYLSFVVEKDGSVSNVQIERGVFKSIDREATRIVRSFPTWKPGEMPTGKVRTRVRLPITFTLE